MSAYDIIREIETAQLKATVDEFCVGDTVRALGESTAHLQDAIS